MKEAPISALIADDEKLARRDLRHLLKAVGGVQVIGEAKNGIEALEKIEKLSPDLVLLDIEMPGLSGLQVVEKLIPRGIAVDIVFVTAYDHYAIKAFELNAVDYLLKPVELKRLREAVKRAKERITSVEHIPQNLEKLLSSLKDRKRKKLSLRVEGSYYVIDEQDLVYAFVDRGAITAVTREANGTLNCQSLDELQTALSENFLRVHRGYLVNVDMIKEVIPWFSGTFRLRLKNGSEVPMSRNHARALRKLLGF